MGLPVVLFVDGHVSHLSYQLSVFCAKKKHEFAPVLQAVLNERVTATVLANGFRKCGLYPWDPSAIDSFFAKKTPQTTPITNTNSTCSLRRSIQCLETYIEPKKLEEFKACSENNWAGQEADKSLFILWRKMYSDLLINLDKSPISIQNIDPTNSALFKRFC